MTDSTRPDPPLVADDRALDFLNSVAAPWGTEIEWLGDGRDLLDWLERAGLVPMEVLAEFRRRALPEALDGVAAEARELREWFRLFVAGQAGRRLAPSAYADLDKLNRLLARDQAYHQIVVHENHVEAGGFLKWRRNRRWRAPEDLLLPIAEAMGALICDVGFERVKGCEGPTCTLWFHDVSKNHTRRWCMMAVCGNRAKAAAHRARKRAELKAAPLPKS